MRDGPIPSSAHVRARFRRQRVRDTAPEVDLRRQLHALGLRYRVDAQPVPGLRRRADVVFRGPRVAVFVDGCFWHGCPTCGLRPKANAQWWEDKFARNHARDADTDRRLVDAEWTVLRIWEHENMEDAARHVAGVVTQGRKPRGSLAPPTNGGARHFPR